MQGNARSVVLLGAACAAVSAISARAHAQSASGGSESAAPVLEEIVVSGDRKDSYSADLVQAGSFRGARQLDTPLTINVIPDALIQAQQAQGLLDALRNTAGVSPALHLLRGHRSRQRRLGVIIYLNLTQKSK